MSGATGETIVTDARGNAWTYCYDNRLRVLKTTDPDGHSVSNDFTSAHGGSNCADDNPCSSTDALGNTSTFGYDDGSGQVQQGENQLWSQSPLEGTTDRPTFAYGSTSNSIYSVASSIDPQGNSWQFGYDASGNMTSKGEGSGAAPGQDPVKFAYNGDGTMKTATDAKGNVTSYGYTDHDLTSVTPPSPLGEVTATYDSLHRVATITDGNGVTRTYHYDGDDRVKEIDFSSGPTLAFTYDAAGNVASESDSTGTYTYHYDNLNRLVEEDQPGSKVIRYSYDANGNIASVSDVNGDVTSYAYDKENLLSSLTEPGMSTPISFGYDANGDRTLIAYPDGVDECMVYDASGRITEVSGFAASGTPDCSSPSSWPSSRLTDFTYSYANGSGADSDLRQTSTSRYGSGAATSLFYCYDVLDRLVSAAAASGCPDGSAADRYAYDVNGNMTSMTEAGATRSFSFNAANETTGSGFAYDAAGNQTADPGVFASASYSQLEQMSSVTPTGGSALALSYQGLGQALRVSHGSQSEVDDQLGLELESGSSAASFTRDADGAILGEKTGGSRYYFLFDANGSVVTTVDSLGVVADTFAYTPYGTISSSTGTVYEPIRFDGGYDDSAAGGESLVKFGERYYDPSTGRWTSQDPDNNPLTTEGWNQYDYTGDDPVDDVDPDGLSFFPDLVKTYSGIEETLVGTGMAITGVAVGVTCAVATSPSVVGIGACALAGATMSASGVFLAYNGVHELTHLHEHRRSRRRRHVR